MIEEKPSLSNVTIGVVTALPLELAAVRKVLGLNHSVISNGRTYQLSTIQRRDNDGAHTIAVCCLPDMGNTSAAAATTALVAACRNIEYVVMCGIGGAVPNPKKASDHCRLGDIVVSGQQGVVQYDYESDREWSKEPRPRFYQPHAALLDAAHQLAADEKLGIRPWVRHLENVLSGMDESDADQARWLRPPPQTDVLCEFSSDRPRDHVIRLLRWIGFRSLQYPIIPHPKDHDRPPCGIRVFEGVVASANRLERNSRNRDILAKQYSAMIVDMESGGVADAAFQGRVGFFVVRGASDYCNEYKNKLWQQHAACTAAAYLRALLEVAPLASLSPPGDGPQTEPARLDRAAKALAAEETSSSSSVSAGGVVSGPAQPEWDEAIQQMLLEDGSRHVAEITRCLDEWEYERAIPLSETLGSWVSNYAERLPKSLLYDIYAILARTEVVKAGRERGKGKAPDLSRAESYLAKAKNVRE